jgi:hypothetical protein
MTLADLVRSEAPRARAVRAGVFALAALVAMAALYRPAFDYDFCTYYTAGLLVREGAPAAAFDQEALNVRHRELHGRERHKGPFLYSPLYLVPATALAGWPFERAERANQVAALLCLAAALGLILARVPTVAGQAMLAVGFVLSHFVAVQFVYLNWSFLLLAWVAAAWLATRAGVDWLAAVLWALAIHLKPFVGLVVVVLWLAGRKRVALQTVAVAAALGVATLPWVGWASWTAFAGKALAGTASGLLPFYNNVSLPGALARFASEPRAWVAPRAPVGGAWVVGVEILGAALLAWALWRARRSVERGLAIAIVGLLLFFPLVWDHTAVLLFAALPAMGPHRPTLRGLFAALLAATFFYADWQQAALRQMLQGGGSDAALRLLLLVPTAILALAFLALVAFADEAGEPTTV